MKQLIEDKCQELEDKIAIVNEKKPEAIDTEWHAKIPEDLLTDPKSLGAYI